MHKVTRLVGKIVIIFTIVLAIPYTPSASASGVKVQLNMNGTQSYYGEVKDGKPHGKGTMTWSKDKYYSGHWVDGKRSGQGKYVNEYTERNEYMQQDRVYKVIYQGQWKNDLMTGDGSKKVVESGTDPSGEHVIYSNSIETGIFQKGLLKQGYRAAYELTDSPFLFTYLGPDAFVLEVTHQDEHIIEDWNQGLNYVTYQKGKIIKDYSNLPTGDEEDDAANEVTLRFLRSVKQEVLPHLKQFEAMANMVKLDQQY